MGSFRLAGGVLTLLIVHGVRVVDSEIGPKAGQPDQPWASVLRLLFESSHASSALRRRFHCIFRVALLLLSAFVGWKVWGSGFECPSHHVKRHWQLSFILLCDTRIPAFPSSSSAAIFSLTRDWWLVRVCVVQKSRTPAALDAQTRLL